jgi:hypothetical protein
MLHRYHPAAEETGHGQLANVSFRGNLRGQKACRAQRAAQGFEAVPSRQVQQVYVLQVSWFLQ